MSNSKTMTPLAIKIKKARKEVGLSQKELGQALSVSDKAVSSYEVGRALPPLDTLKLIAEVTRKPVTYFIDTPEADDLDLSFKLTQIESELAEIRKLLAKKQQS